MYYTKLENIYICLDVLSQDSLDIHMHTHTLSPFVTSSIQRCIVGQITPET